MPLYDQALYIAIDILVYISAAICFFGVFASTGLWVKLFFFLLTICELIGLFITENHFLLPITYASHLILLTAWLNPFETKKAAPKLLLQLLLLFLLLSFLFDLTIGRTVVSLFIMLLSLYTFLRIYAHPEQTHLLHLNIAIFLFFGIDFFLAATGDFLYKENLKIVAWFWFFRALFLQYYYINVIRFSKKMVYF